MNIDWVIPCRYVEIHENLATMVGAGIDTFWVPETPATLHVSMAIKLTATVDELGPDMPHTARSILRDPVGEVLSDTSGEFRTGSSVMRPDFLASLILQTVLAITVGPEGTYTFEHIVDGSSAAVPLHVVHGSPGEPAE